MSHEREIAKQKARHAKAKQDAKRRANALIDDDARMVDRLLRQLFRRAR